MSLVLVLSRATHGDHTRRPTSKVLRAILKHPIEMLQFSIAGGRNDIVVCGAPLTITCRKSERKHRTKPVCRINTAYLYRRPAVRPTDYMHSGAWWCCLMQHLSQIPGYSVRPCRTYTWITRTHTHTHTCTRTSYHVVATACIGLRLLIWRA